MSSRNQGRVNVSSRTARYLKALSKLAFCGGLLLLASSIGVRWPGPSSVAGFASLLALMAFLTSYFFYLLAVGWWVWK